MLFSGLRLTQEKISVNQATISMYLRRSPPPFLPLVEMGSREEKGGYEWSRRFPNDRAESLGIHVRVTRGCCDTLMAQEGLRQKPACHLLATFEAREVNPLLLAARKDAEGSHRWPSPIFPTPGHSRSVDGAKRDIPQTYFVAKRRRLAGFEYYFDPLGPSQSTLELHRMLAGGSASSVAALPETSTPTFLPST